ncbi:neurofilament heavy polypeptide-like isoform X4 [Ptychodera flava]|uniref:neurofilament heavy polypeptide-like isoform X4 n=1 Tax=Ptychodera flava TaxID=63121 RepID=UPI00396A7B76
MAIVCTECELMSAVADPSSPGSARRREFLEAGDKSPRKTYQHLVERKHPGSTYQKSVREGDGGDEEMSRTVSKLRERITSEKPLATSAERRRALFGDTGRSSSNPGNQKKSESDIIGWNEQSRNVDSDSDRSTSGRYWRHRTKDESEKRYQRLTADRSYDRDLSYRRRLDSDSSDTSRGEGRVDYNRKGSTASVDGHSRLSPSHGIADTGRGSKSFDYDLGRHSHLDNNYKTSTGITSKYSDDGLTDKTSDTKYGKNYDRDVRSSRKALLDDGGKESDQRAPTSTDSVRSNRTLQEDRLRSPTRQEFDRNSPIRRSRDYNLDVGSRSSTRTRVDKYDEDLDIYNRYARTRDAGVSERTKDLPDRTSKLTERDSDLSRKERKAREVPDTSHITSNGEISHPTAEDTLSSRVQPSRSSRDADTTSAVGALTAKRGSGQVSSDSSEDSDARAKRIAEYKDKRRKELAQKYGIADDLDLKADSSTRKFKYANRRSNTDLGLTSDTLKRAEDLIAKSKDRKGSDSSTLQSRPTNDESGKPEDTDYSYLRKKYGLDRDRDRTADTTATTSRDVDSAPSRSSRSASLRGDEADGSLSQRSPRVVSPVAKETGSDETAAGRATSPRTATKPNISPETQELVDMLELKRAARRERLRQTEESSFDRYTEARLSRRRLRREGSDVTSPVATEVVSKTESPRTEMSPAERRSLRARSAPFQERPSARRTAADAREVPQRVPEREPLDSVSATRTVPSHSEQVKTTTRDAITQRVPSVGEQTVGTGRRSRSIVEAERASVEPPSPGETRTFTRPLEASKERATHRLATPAKDQKGISQETEQSTPARPQKLSPLTQTDASSPALETHKPTQDTDKPFSRSASERRHRFYHIDSGTSTESATDHRQTFRSRDSEASIGSSIPPVESPSDSDSLASSIASDIVRGMSPRSLEILERKRKRKEEKKAARRRSALNTPERDAEGVSPGTESPEKSGDDSDGKQRFKERRSQLTPSSSYDELKKTDSVKPGQPVQELVEKREDNKKLEAEAPTTTVDAGKRKEVPPPTKPTSPDETPASSAVKRDEPEPRKVVKDQETKKDSPAASAKPVKRQGQIAEGKQTKKLLQKFEKAATERKGPKVLAERVEESRALLGQKAKGRTKSVDSEKELEKGKEPEKQKLQEQERGKDRVSAEEEKKQTETVKKTEITKDKETKEQKKEPVQTKTTVSAQKEEGVKTQRSKVDDKTKGSTRPRVRSPTKSAEPVKVRKQAENEQRRGSISSDSSASVKSTDSRPFSSRPSLKKREDKPRTVSPTKKESVGLPESGKTPRRPLSDSISINAKVDSKKMSRSATDPAIKSSRIEQRLQEKAEAKVRSSGRAVSPEKKVRKDTVQAKVDSGLKTEIPKMKENLAPGLVCAELIHLSAARTKSLRP